MQTFSSSEIQALWSEPAQSEQQAQTLIWF